MKKLITQIKPNTSPVEWDGRPDNVCQKCGYHTCCCQVQNAFLAKSLRLVKPVVLALLLSVQFAAAQTIRFEGIPYHGDPLPKVGTTKPTKPDFFADEYGNFWQKIPCPKCEDLERCIDYYAGQWNECECDCARRVDLSPVRKLPIKLTAVKSTGKYAGA